MIRFSQYAKVRNNYCLCYFGYSDEYLVQLRLLRPILERNFPGINICLGCKDDKTQLLDKSQPILTLSKIKVHRNDFAHIRELRCNGRTHPVEDLLKESEIQNAIVVSNLQPRHTSKCVILTKGAYPTRNLEEREIRELKTMAKEEDYEVEMDADITDASLVMGVESLALFEAAGQGIKTKLAPTGLGACLYKLMFPRGQVISL